MTKSDINNQNYQTTEFQEKSLETLADAVSVIEDLMGRKFLVTSGLRSTDDQLRINPAKKYSAHMYGEAVDVSDVDGSIYGFCIDNVDILIRLGLYLESKTYCNRWVHFQIRRPPSGNRFFIP